MTPLYSFSPSGNSRFAQVTSRVLTEPERGTDDALGRASHAGLDRASVSWRPGSPPDHDTKLEVRGASDNASRASPNRSPWTGTHSRGRWPRDIGRHRAERGWLQPWFHERYGRYRQLHHRERRGPGV